MTKSTRVGLTMDGCTTPAQHAFRVNVQIVIYEIACLMSRLPVTIPCSNREIQYKVPGNIGLSLWIAILYRLPKALQLYAESPLLQLKDPIRRIPYVVYMSCKKVNIFSMILTADRPTIDCYLVHELFFVPLAPRSCDNDGDADI
jgi:hypothetical protein